MKGPLQLLTAVLLSLLCQSASADPFTPKHIPSDPVPIYVLQLNTGDGLEEFVAVTLIGYCGGDPVNCTDPMGTDSVGISGGEVTWQGHGTNITVGVSVGGPLENPLIRLANSAGSGVTVSYNDLRRIAESKDDFGLGKISGLAGKLRAINTIVGNAIGTTVTQNTVAMEVASEGLRDVQLKENSPELGAIRRKPWYLRYPLAYAYSLHNTIVLGSAERQDKKWSRYGMGEIDENQAWKGYATDTAVGAVGVALNFTPLRAGTIEGTPALNFLNRDLLARTVIENTAAKQPYINGLRITTEELAQLQRETAERIAASKLEDGVLYAVDYKEVFFSAFPELRNKVVVHHSIEQQVLTKLPGRFTEAEINSLPFLRGVPNSVNPQVHLSMIRTLWNEFYALNPAATRSQALDYAEKIDQAFEGVIIKP